MAIRIRLHKRQSQKFIDNVVLVAGAPGGAESLAIGTLSTALKARGVRPLIFTYRTAADIDAVARRILLTFPSLVSVFLPNGNAAIDGVALIHILRRMGYTGHITTGGAFAAATAERLLSLFPQIDSVSGSDDAQPLAQLAESICHNRYPESIPGVQIHSGASDCSAAAQHEFLCRHSVHEQFKECARGLKQASQYQATSQNRQPDFVRLIKSFPVTADNLQQPTEGK